MRLVSALINPINIRDLTARPAVLGRARIHSHEPENVRAAGREFLAIPGPTVVPDAVLAAMQRPAVDIYSGPLVALTDALLADLAQDLPHRGPHLHLHRQRPRRLGGGAHQCAVARRQGAGAGKRALRARLGRGGEDARRRGRDAARRFPPRGRAGGGRGAAQRDDRGRDQGDAGGADRHRLRRRQRHRGDRRRRSAPPATTRC